jgi:putative FmdB family regulatory protein
MRDFSAPDPVGPTAVGPAISISALSGSAKDLKGALRMNTFFLRQVPNRTARIRAGGWSERNHDRKSMPLYEYELCEGNCAVCGGRFTLRRPVSAPELTKCPACKKPVRRVISTFNTPTKLKPLSISDAKKAGFTVLKRLGKGEYERQ